MTTTTEHTHQTHSDPTRDTRPPICVICGEIAPPSFTTPHSVATFPDGVRVRGMSDGSVQVEATFTIAGTDYEASVGFSSEGERTRIAVYYPVMTGNYSKTVPESRRAKCAALAAPYAKAIFDHWPDMPATVADRNREISISGMADDLRTLRRMVTLLEYEYQQARSGQDYNRWLLGNLPAEWSSI